MSCEALIALAIVGGLIFSAGIVYLIIEGDNLFVPRKTRDEISALFEKYREHRRLKDAGEDPEPLAPPLRYFNSYIYGEIELRLSRQLTKAWWEAIR